MLPALEPAFVTLTYEQTSRAATRAIKAALPSTHLCQLYGATEAGVLFSGGFSAVTPKPGAKSPASTLAGCTSFVPGPGENGGRTSVGTASNPWRTGKMVLMMEGMEISG